ncbi:hypothetical protein BH23CHL9_BH23CHL9_16690 [soil metagenome]
MTTQKTLKRRVRTRAARTGESYTAARAQVLHNVEPPAPDAMALTGMTDDALRRGSGKTIAEWLEILDAWGATDHSHTEIARWLVAERGIGGWWAQSVTVGYERARGMRARHQIAGGFAVSVTRTITVGHDRITEAWTDASLRSAWLPDAPMRLRTTTRGGSPRFDWDDPPSRVAVFLVPKGAKVQVVVSHEKLPDAEAVERLKAFWRDRLGALKELLEVR